MDIHDTLVWSTVPWVHLGVPTRAEEVVTSLAFFENPMYLGDISILRLSYLKLSATPVGQCGQCVFWLIWDSFEYMLGCRLLLLKWQPKESNEWISTTGLLQPENQFINSPSSPMTIVRSVNQHEGVTINVLNWITRLLQCTPLNHHERGCYSHYTTTPNQHQGGTVRRERKRKHPSQRTHALPMKHAVCLV